MKNNKSYSSNRSRSGFRPSGTASHAKSKGSRDSYPNSRSGFRPSDTASHGKSMGAKDSYPNSRSGFRPSDTASHGKSMGQKEAYPNAKGKGKPRFHGEGRPQKSVKPRFEKKPLLEPTYKPAGENVLVWGLHAARAAFLNPDRRITRLWLTEAGQKLFEHTIAEAKEELLKRPDPKKTERGELDKITPPNSVHQGIVIETMPLPDPGLQSVISADPPPSLILMLDQVTDPHNVGAILRSTAAFGAGALVLTERNAPATTGVLAKSASGALEVTPMIHVVNLARALDELREAGYWCIGLAEEGEKTLSELDLSGRTVLVLGAEGEGLRHLTRQKCDELARLPTQGPIGSLNVSNAAAVALYEVRRQAK